MSAEAMPAGNGKSLSLTVQEVKREAEFFYRGRRGHFRGGPISRSFLASCARSMWAHARTRQKFAVAEQVSEQPIEFRMTFPESAAVEERKGLPRLVLSEANCAGIQERRE
jgi:hypothetical protein